jgi:hypothetical protein
MKITAPTSYTYFPSYKKNNNLDQYWIYYYIPIRPGNLIDYIYIYTLYRLYLCIDIVYEIAWTYLKIGHIIRWCAPYVKSQTK